MQEFRLARSLGMTRYQMQHSMTADEFEDWLVFDTLEPVSGNTIELAHIALMMASFMGVKDAKFTDFYVNKDPEPPKPKQKQEEVSNNGTDFDEVQNYIFANYGGVKK